MSEEDSFRDLIARLRAGDEQAWAELIRRYEPAIRLVIRVRLGRSKLRHLLDTVDIVQSVLANFYERASQGQFELDTPEHLLKLLATMACNKLKNHALRQLAARRDQRRCQQGIPAGHEPADPASTPSQDVEQQDLLDEFRRRLSTQELWLAEQRAAGRSWSDLAAEVGESPDALRMRYSRALDRVAQELGLC